MLKRVGAKRFIPVVHPDWILHSVKQRKLLPEHDYRVIQPSDQHQIDQYFTRLSENGDDNSTSDSATDYNSKPKFIPRPIYSPKKTSPVKRSPKKEKIQNVAQTKVLENVPAHSKEELKNTEKDKENFEPAPVQDKNNTKKDKTLKNIDIRTGKIVKPSATSAVQMKKSSSKTPLAKLSLLANNSNFKNIPNVAKKSGPVKK
jgi:hypothetical protein